ncbi:MAG TPA: 2-phospho-L-lactate transferase [Acetobacteraceae bacterium]|nr:2-phospho-L-lactate transferase [Acetobacteraceae bacterium]
MTVLALSGGIGGAKLALGLSRVLPPGELTIIANTGDDFTHLGLSISPDIDTLVYTLADLANHELGWGRRDETWSFMETVATLGGATWFRLGDRDLAMHVERTHRLRAGETLTEITGDISRRLGIGPRILPMTDGRMRTRIRADSGWLDFQDYFVRLRCEPVVQELVFEGDGQPQPAFLSALADPALTAVVICPSNPFVSVEPILSLPGVRDALNACRAPIVAVSPIIAGRAVKGPTAKMMAELGLNPSARAVAEWYGDLLDVYIVDHADAAQMDGLRPSIIATKTLMLTLEDRESLARVVLDAAVSLGTPK